MKDAERLASGFEKVEGDLAFIMGVFQEVLRDSGAGHIADKLPWVNPGVEVTNREMTAPCLQAYSIAFQLLNMVEENASNQMRRLAERSSGALGERGLWGWYLQKLREAGWTAAEVAARLPYSRIEPVLTAHPTEAKRVTVMEQHRELYLLLVELENQMFTPRERLHLNSRIRAVLERLWRTGETLLEKPTVALERASVLHYLGNVLPLAVLRSDQSLLTAWSEVGWATAEIADPAIWPRIRFGTWVGGDRDGHPLVTPRVTRETLRDLRQQALALVNRQLEQLRNKLSLSALLVNPPGQLQRTIEVMVEQLGEAAADVLSRNPNEPWRQYISLMMAKVPPVDYQPAEHARTGQFYHFAYELAEDLRILRNSLTGVRARLLAEVEVDPVLRLVEVFGFHLASLDIRQNSGYHDAAIDQILAAAGVEDWKYSGWAGDKKMNFLNRELRSALPLLGRADKPGPEGEGAVGALREMARHLDLYGEEGVGSVILSMTRSCADLLAIYFLAREAGLLRMVESSVVCLIPLVPLLETVDDLVAGPGILGEFLDHPVTRDSLADLRAIPWVFSWSQSRFFVPGWYGVGTALASLEEEEFDRLREALPRWPFLRYVMTNVEMAHSGADAGLMEEYAALVPQEDVRQHFAGLILDEYRQTAGELERLFGSPLSARRPRLERTQRPRAEALRPIHRRQIQLLAEWRSAREKSDRDRLIEEIMLTINAIASGLRTTG